MSKSVQRGYVPKDKMEFGIKWLEKLQCAGEELFYLLNRGYPIKSAATFIGNHYLLSERQRLAIARLISSSSQLKLRKEKELIDGNLPATMHIDGFNTIITLEVALSSSLLIKSMDGTIKDLAGLRGTYRIIDKTKEAVKLIMQHLEYLGVPRAIIYLDQPVSNSGRLKGLIMDIARDYPMKITVEVINEVDKVLEQLEGVISSDAIILDRCISWFNLNQVILANSIEEPWLFTLDL